MKRIISSGLVLTLACLGLGSASAQQTSAGTPLPYATGNPATWPPELDAVVAAPGNHKVLMENDSVRVLEVTVPPGTREPLHSHRWPSVLYFQAASDYVDRDAKGNVILDSRKLREPLKLPFAMWKEPEAPHSVENRSTTEALRLIRVEIKKR